jgi:hypothetical protein
MQPIRQVYESAPDTIHIPAALRQRRLELILWPLEDEATEPSQPALVGYERTRVDKIEIPPREERHVRR